MEFNVTAQPLNCRVQCLRIEGELDISTLKAVRQAIDDLLENGHRSIVIDLSELQFVDTEGMEALIHAVVHVERHEGLLSFVGAHPRVMKIFDIMGLSKSKHFRIFKSVEDALSGLATLAPACKNCATRSIPFCATVRSFAYPSAACDPRARLPWLANSS